MTITMPMPAQTNVAPAGFGYTPFTTVSDGNSHPFAVTLRNAADPASNRIWRMRYLNTMFVLGPGEQAVVPWEVVVKAMGNPFAQDGARHKDRTRETTRLRALYGAYHDNDAWDEQRPQLEAYDMQGERVLTVLDDPNGDHQLLSQATVASQHAAEAQVAQLTQQIAHLSAIMARSGLLDPTAPQAPTQPLVSPTGVPVTAVPPPPPFNPQAPTGLGVPGIPPITPLPTPGQPGQPGPFPPAPPAPGQPPSFTPPIVEPSMTPAGEVTTDAPPRPQVT